MDGGGIPADSVAILDTSVLIVMGGPSNEKYQAFERHVTRRQVQVYIPEEVAVEFGERPQSYRYQHDRLAVAQEAGWLERGQTDFSNPHVSDAVDRTRGRIASLSAADVTEDHIEKADVALAGLAYQYATDPPIGCDCTRERSPRRAGDRGCPRSKGIGENTTVVEGRSFLASLVETSWD